MNSQQAEQKFNNKIELATYLYQKIHQRNRNNVLVRLITKFYSYVWKILIQIKVLSDDPVIKRQVGQRYLLMNSSHKLPNKRQRLPYYDTALSRISLYLNRKIAKLIVIDVGANIGDTVNLITDVTSGHFLCIEPNERYFDLLRLNTRNLENVICEKAVISVSEDTQAAKKTLKEIKGTAYLSKNTIPAFESNESNTISITTIDKLVDKYPEFRQTKLLKIDTDGYDIKVLRSAKVLLTKTQPIIFVEFSPWHLINIGEDDPLSLFELIKSLGYSSALFYDNHGYPLIYTKLDETEMLNQLTSYARRKPNLYYDILMFPDSGKHEFDEYYLQEIKNFPDIKYIEF